MKYKSKNDYLKYSRDDLHITLRSDLNEKLHMLSFKQKQPKGKTLDVILDFVFNNEDYIFEVIKNLNKY